MNKSILSALIVALVLTACTPSQSQIPAPAAKTELTSPSETPVPSITPSITPSPTVTTTPSPTPDLRVVDGDPELMLLKQDELPEEAGYSGYQVSSQSNSNLASIQGENGSQYIDQTGRIDGASSAYYMSSKTDNTSSTVITYVTLFSDHSGPQIKNLEFPDLPEDRKPENCNNSIDIGDGDYLCYSEGKEVLAGEFSTEYYFVFGIYRNVLFGVLAGGMENLVSEEHVREHAILLLGKIKTFPLTDAVSYSP